MYFSVQFSFPELSIERYTLGVRIEEKSRDEQAASQSL